MSLVANNYCAFLRKAKHRFILRGCFACSSRNLFTPSCQSPCATSFCCPLKYDSISNRFFRPVAHPILLPQRRPFALCCTAFEKSKLEESLKEKKKQKQQAASATTSLQQNKTVEVAAGQRESEATAKKTKKKPLLSRIWAEIVHYYHGFRLLALDVRIASRTLWKILNGTPVTRRERNQFRKAVADIFRLAPFSVFIIIPFAEVALPFVVKLFPNILPSTFESSSSRDLRLKRELKVKLDMAKFLQDTVEDIAVRSKKSSKKNVAAQDFVAFFQKVRNQHEPPSNEEILKHAKLFEDQLTLSNMTRKQLIALCRLISVPAVGNNELLRFLIQMKLNQLHADDLMIQAEGIDSLTTAELMAACQARGMRALGVPRARLKQQLAEWVDLHVVHDVPNSLLLLSRVLYMPETVSAQDKLKEAISTLPEKAAGEAEVRAAELNLERVDNVARYKAAKLENEEIVEEAAKALKKQKGEDMEISKQKDAIVEPKLSSNMPSTSIAQTTDAEIIVDDTVLVDNARLICEDNKITQQEIDVIDNAMEQISADAEDMQSVKSGLEDLREDAREYEIGVTSLQDELKIENDEVIGSDAKASKRILKRIVKLINKMENTVKDLEQEGSRSIPQTSSISVKELIKSVQSMEKIPIEKLEKVFEVLDTNKDGHVDVNEARQIIKLLNEEDVEVTHDQLQHIVNLLKGEAGSSKVAEKL